MKTVGLLGGLGPESTIDYYRQIIALYRERLADGSYPSIVINSVDVNKGLRLATEKRHAELADYLVEEIVRLERAGSHFAAITANTPHIVFDEVSRRAGIPLLSIVEVTLAAAVKSGLKKLALFGTRMTMEAEFYPEVFARAGLTLIRPTIEDQTYIHDKYVNELLVGNFLPETHEGLLRVIDGLRERDGIDGVVLAGTELPLILKEEEHGGVRLLDTTKIHVEAIVSKLL
jgi:aspartate racemase